MAKDGPGGISYSPEWTGPPGMKTGHDPQPKGPARRCFLPRQRTSVRQSWACKLLPLCLSLLSTPAAAEATAQDLQILVRALGFLERPPTGIAELGIAYPAASAAGRAEAERVAAAFGDNLRAGALTLRPRLIPAEAAGRAQVVALLLTDAALPQAAQIADALAGSGVPTIATTATAFEGGKVVLVLRSQPRVEILVSRAAAQTARVGFATAFRMMIQER